LRSRGCVISDEDAAATFLKRVNYYRFSGYLLPFKQTDGTYIDGTNFDSVASIYTFDQDLRGILIKAVSEVELSAKSIIAYYHGHRYGSLGYMSADNYNEMHDHERFTKHFDDATSNNHGALFVKHHMRVYGGQFPIWVATELFTMGMISLFYADLQADDKKAIAKEFNTDYVHLSSWLHSSTVLRNLCAHYGRLYNIRFHQNPRLPREYATYANMNDCTLFKQLYMLKLLHTNHRGEWDNSIVPALYALVDNHSEHLDLKTMGFPENWEDALIWK
jgi:abortive infection bacteriophage resistance protein